MNCLIQVYFAAIDTAVSTNVISIYMPVTSLTRDRLGSRLTGQSLVSPFLSHLNFVQQGLHISPG